MRGCGGETREGVPGAGGEGFSSRVSPPQGGEAALGLTVPSRSVRLFTAHCEGNVRFG